MEANPELLALTWVSVLTAMMWMPYMVARMFTLGVWGVFDYPPKQDEPPAPPPWADRSRRAHTNAVENLVLFAALVVAVGRRGRDHGDRGLDVPWGPGGALGAVHGGGPGLAHGQLLDRVGLLVGPGRALVVVTGMGRLLSVA